MQPFQIPQWSSRPSSEELMNAIVGTGGSNSDREAARGAVRDLLLPNLEQQSGLQELRFRLEGLRGEFDHAPEQAPLTRLIRVAVRDELGRLQERSMKLAEKRLHVTLWPSEPVPEHWEGVSDLEPLPTIDSITAAARGTEERLDLIRARYGIGQIGGATQRPSHSPLSACRKDRRLLGNDRTSLQRVGSTRNFDNAAAWCQPVVTSLYEKDRAAWKLVAAQFSTKSDLSDE